MPKYTNRKPKIRRRRFVKRKLPTRKMQIQRRINYGPFPRSRLVKLRLCTGMITLSSTAGALGKVTVNANWPYYGGRYAFGWDQWAALYNEAIVVGSRIKVYQQGSDITAPILAMGGIYLSDDSTNYTDYQDMIEAKRGTFARFSDSADRVSTISSNFSSKKFFNIKDVRDNNYRIGGLTTATTAADVALYNVWAQELSKSATGTYYMNAVIDYIVIFSQPKDVPSS